MNFKQRKLIGLCASAALMAGVFGCSNGSKPSTSTTPGFDTTVVIGDSLSAGFQNGSLLDTQQPNGWASLVAKQAGFSLVLPLIAPPGAPAVLQLTSLGPPPVITQESGTTTGRDNPNDQPYDIAVPGHTLDDLINRQPVLIPTSSEDVITELVLALPLSVPRSQLEEAIHLKPTALFLWIGSNDALVADEAGTPAVMTPIASFTSDYQQLISTIKSQTKATLIVANIPDVTSVPYLTPGAVVLAEAAALTHLPTSALSALLGIQPTDLVNPTGLAEVQADLTGLESGVAPTPLTDDGFLNATEIAQVQSTVDQYNAVIAAQVSSAGGILVDIHSYFQQLQQSGITINGYPATTGFLGGLFALDGIHPTNTGYALIANQYIAAINASLKTSITAVDVGSVASSDPYFGPNIKPTGAAVHHITPAAGHATDDLFKPRKAGLNSGRR